MAKRRFTKAEKLQILKEAYMTRKPKKQLGRPSESARSNDERTIGAV